MSERGVFAVDRGIWDDPDFANEPMTEREAFLWLVSEAAWKATRKRAGSKVVELQRGQVCHSVRFMAEAWQWSKSRVDRFLDRLEKRDSIKRVSGTEPLVLNICKYDAFQRVSLPERDTRGTLPGTAAGQQRDRLEDIKNIEDNNSTSLRSVERARKNEWPSDYRDQVWAIYPKHAEKKDGMAALDALHRADKLSWDALRTGIERFAANLSDPQYAPALHRWLKKERWNDEYDANRRPPPTGRPQPRKSAHSVLWDIAREAHEAHEQLSPRSEANDRPFDGEILGPDSPQPTARHGHLKVYERPGGEAWERDEEGHPRRVRAFG